MKERTLSVTKSVCRIDHQLVVSQPKTKNSLRLLTLLAGVTMLALGAYITLVSRVGVGAGDGFARTVSQLTGIDFGRSRIVCDSCWMLIAVALNIVFFQSLVTVREGTVATALFAGLFVNFFLRILKPLEYAVLPENRPANS